MSQCQHITSSGFGGPTLVSISKVVSGVGMYSRHEMESKAQKPAGKNWCISLYAVLTDLGFRNVNCEQGLYILSQADKYMIGKVSNNEIIFFYPNSITFK